MDQVWLVLMSCPALSQLLVSFYPFFLSNGHLNVCTSSKEKKLSSWKQLGNWRNWSFSCFRILKPPCENNEVIFFNLWESEGFVLLTFLILSWPMNTPLPNSSFTISHVVIDIPCQSSEHSKSPYLFFIHVYVLSFVLIRAALFLCPSCVLLSFRLPPQWSAVQDDHSQIQWWEWEHGLWQLHRLPCEAGCHVP